MKVFSIRLGQLRLPLLLQPSPSLLTPNPPICSLAFLSFFYQVLLSLSFFSQRKTFALWSNNSLVHFTFHLCRQISVTHNSRNLLPTHRTCLDHSPYFFLTSSITTNCCTIIFEVFHSLYHITFQLQLFSVMQQIQKLPACLNIRTLS